MEDPVKARIDTLIITCIEFPLQISINQVDPNSNENRTDSYYIDGNRFFLNIALTIKT